VPDLPWGVVNPYPIFGVAPGASGETLTATNRSSLDTQTIVVENNEEYLLDCANFLNGYSNYDIIEFVVAGRHVLTNINSTVYPYGFQVDLDPHINGSVYLPPT